MPPRIYLAGPDVFFPDAALVAESKKAICAEYGLTGVFPTDTADSEDFSHLSHDDPALGPAIAARCEAHMRQADGLIANLTPWRSASADVGTVYELGYMRALNKPVLAYTNDSRPYHQRVLEWMNEAPVWDASLSVWRTPDGYLIESFTPPMADNVMLDHAVMHTEPRQILRGTLLPGVPNYYNDLAAFKRAVEYMASLLG